MQHPLFGFRFAVNVTDVAAGYRMFDHTADWMKCTQEKGSGTASQGFVRVYRGMIL